MIPGKLISLNEYINAERRNRFIAAKIKKETTDKCMRHFLGYKFKTPIQLSFLWVQKNKRKDIDNVSFAKKFIIDGMVKAEAIPNDGQKFITAFRGEKFIQGDVEAVIVKIYEEGE